MVLPRFHFFEIHDLSGTPHVFRVLLLEILHFLWILRPTGSIVRPSKWLAGIAGFFGLPRVPLPFETAAPIVANALRSSGSSTIVDLCSGAGGPMAEMVQHINEKSGLSECVSVTLTDLYPEVESWKDLKQTYPNVKYSERSVNATKVPHDLKGVRTIMAAFHHFTPDLGTSIIQDAVTARTPIVIVEGTERSIPAMLMYALLGPILLTLFTPILFPLTLQRLFFTYIIPAVQFIFVWDSVVSCIRTYNPSELLGMARSCKDSDAFNWEAGKIKAVPILPAYFTFLVGTPKGTGQPREVRVR